MKVNKHILVISNISTGEMSKNLGHIVSTWKEGHQIRRIRRIWTGGYVKYLVVRNSMSLLVFSSDSVGDSSRSSSSAVI